MNTQSTMATSVLHRRPKAAPVDLDAPIVAPDDSPYASGGNTSGSSSDNDDETRHDDHGLSTEGEVGPLRRRGLERVPAESKRQAGIVAALRDTVTFYLAVCYFILGGAFDSCPLLQESPQAKAQVYSLCTILWMWHRPHYRAGSFQTDMVTNLRNVAIPGTGIPLSLLVKSRLLSIAFLFVGYPLVCIVAGLRKGGFSIANATQCYCEQLLCPQDWFSFWRLNCCLASYHAMVTPATGFAQEDKWTFLTSAKEADVPVSPWLDAKTLVIKDKNEEGGMGIFFYKNAVHGGDWIIQHKLTNDSFLSSLLPPNAPLSTLRVITSSRGGLRQAASGPNAPLPGASLREDVEALSCVFRAGRKGASTDHSSILFDVDLRTGEILKGTTNMHWYQLGLHKIPTTPWICLDHTSTSHPDTGEAITGHVIPNIDQIKDLCIDAHHRLLPDVPLAGWDVALTEEAGMCLLEVNLSCNFFRGTFDQRSYFGFVNDYFSFLDKESRKTK